MQLVRNKAWAILIVLALQAHADDACVDFKWDVTEERALFAAPATELAAGKDLASAPTVATNRLYKFKLAPQEQVKFPMTPGKKAASAATFAGVATLKILAPGSYRISLDMPVWIDVAANGMLIAAKDFEGQHACNAPHKIVEFELAGMQPFVLQFSNSAQDAVSVTVTASPPRKM